MKIPSVLNRRLQLPAWLILIVIAGAATGAALFTFQQTIQLSVRLPPFSGPSTLSVSNISPCSSSCVGVLVTGPSGPAITFTSSPTQIQAAWSSSDTTKPSEVYLVQGSITDCTAFIIPGTIKVPPGSVQPLNPQPAPGSYNYCVYYTSLAAGFTGTITVDYNA